LVFIACSVGLRDEASRRHAEKAEGPEDTVEKDAAHGDSAQRRRSRQMAGENGIHCGEQRLGQIRENQGNREEEDSPVPIGHWIDSTVRVSRDSRLESREYIYLLLPPSQGLVSIVFPSFPCHDDYCADGRNGWY
jgi:hypothetical protein